MDYKSIRIIHEEHAALSALLGSMAMLLRRGPRDQPGTFFDSMRAMLFYIDEFPQRLHHPKESELLFPMVALRAPSTRELIERLEQDHVEGEAEVRKLQHLLLAWELLGDSRRQAFEHSFHPYLNFYLEHMRQEELVIIPTALKVLRPKDWDLLDQAFSDNQDPLTGKYPHDPIYDQLFTRIVMKTPAPIGLAD